MNTGFVLPFRRLECEQPCGQRGALLGGVVSPEGFHGVPERREAGLKCVAVLGDDGLDGGGALERDAEPDGRAVVEDVDSEGGEVEGRDEGEDAGGEGGEGVGIGGGHGGEAEAGEVGGDKVVRFGENGDEVAELAGGGGEAVEEEERGVGGEAGGAVEDCLPGGEGEGFAGYSGHFLVEVGVVGAAALVGL